MSLGSMDFSDEKYKNVFLLVLRKNNFKNEKSLWVKIIAHVLLISVLLNFHVQYKIQNIKYYSIKS